MISKAGGASAQPYHPYCLPLRALRPDLTSGACQDFTVGFTAAGAKAAVPGAGSYNVPGQFDAKVRAALHAPRPLPTPCSSCHS